MKNSEEYFSNLLELTLREKEAERKTKDKELTSKSLKEKRKLGIAIYPIEWEIEPYSLEGKILLNLNSKEVKEISSEFKAGITVRLYDSTDEENILHGVVHSVSEKNLQVLFNLEEVPPWLESKSLAIEIYYDESTYQEMERVLTILKNPKKENTKQLIQVFLNMKTPYFNKNPNVQFENLNESQNRAINHLLKAEEFAILQGPPGTGKTEVLIEYTKYLLQYEKRILFTAPSNTAVDLLTKKCIAKGLKVVRIGNPARISQELFETTLDSQIQKHREFENYLRWKKEAQEIFKKAVKYKRAFTKEDKEERKQKLKEARELSKLAQRELERITLDVLEKTQILTCTLSNLFRGVWKNLEFDTVIVDECSQALEPLIWMGVFKTNKRIILSGDSKQLPPITFSNNFQATLFEKLIEVYPTPPINNFLNYQYRMHSNILEFSNILFYNKNILSLKENSKKFLSFSEGKGFIFINTAGSDNNETWDIESQSYTNETEIEILYKIFETELENIKSASIGILSPYSAQVEKLKQRFSQYLTLHNLNLEINTIDSFQGSERDIVFLSFVRSNERKEIGFLNEFRRMNVAMTRAKEELVVIGDSETLLHSPFYEQMLAHIQKHGKWLSIWEFF